MAFRYANQGAPAPFWDFIASLDDLGPAQERPRERQAPTEPYGWGWAPHHWQHAGPSRGHHGHHHGPPQPHHGPPPHGHGPSPPHHGHHHGPPPHHEHRGPSPPSPGPPSEQPGHSGPPPAPDHGPHGHEEHRGPPPHSPHGPHPHRPHHRHHEGPGRGRGPCRGGRGGFGRHQQNPIFNPLGGLGDLISSLEPALAGFFEPADQAARNRAQREAANDSDFTPGADVFATAEAYVVHIPLPGAQKNDIGISYLQATNTLTVSGVVHRPGDEALLSTLASGERKDIGVFEKKIKLGGEGEVVQEEGIRAKLEDGILRITVPKSRETQEKKKIDIAQVQELQEVLEKEDFEMNEKETLFDVEEMVDDKSETQATEQEKREVDTEEAQSPANKKQKYQASIEEDSSDDDFVDIKKVDIK